MNKALVLIDFEKKWTNEGSDYFVGDISGIVEKVNKLIRLCREKSYKIIFTSHVEKNSDGTFD